MGKEGGFTKVVFDISPRSDLVRVSNKSPCLTARCDTRGHNVPLVLNDQGGSFMSLSDKSETLRAESHGHVPCLYSFKSFYEIKKDHLTGTLMAKGGILGGGSVTLVGAANKSLRKLLPVECLRLQGFPDWWFDNVPQYSDSAAYKAIGNSMAVPCMRWIGKRLKKVDEYLSS